jgi:polyhydroxybutyrate depolymerase
MRKAMVSSFASPLGRLLAHMDGIPSASVVEELPYLDHDGTRIRREICGGGKQGAEVVVCTIEGGAHTWPGGPQYLPAFPVGKASHNLDATETIWNFFQRHERGL